MIVRRKESFNVRFGVVSANSQGGLTSNIHAVVDAVGLPERLGLTSAWAHEGRLRCSPEGGATPDDAARSRGYDTSQKDAWQCRRIATRYDKLAANYLAFIKLVSIRLWLRAYESTRPRSYRANFSEHLIQSLTLAIQFGHSRRWH